VGVELRIRTVDCDSIEMLFDWFRIYVNIIKTIS
jgi:hypothetical protein